jgi:hypothetical protein
MHLLVLAGVAAASAAADISGHRDYPRCFPVVPALFRCSAVAAETSCLAGFGDTGGCSHRALAENWCKRVGGTAMNDGDLIPRELLFTTLGYSQQPRRRCAESVGTQAIPAARTASRTFTGQVVGISIGNQRYSHQPGSK